MQACHGLCERANFNWTSSDGEKDTKKAFISMVSDAVYPAGLLSSKQRDAVLPVFEPVQCDRNAGGEAAFTGSECTRQRICDEENADTGCPRAFRDASRKETKRHGSRNRLVWSRQIVSVYAGIYECGSAAYLEGGVYDVIGDPKMYRGKWKEKHTGNLIRSCGNCQEATGRNPVSVK